CILRHWPGNVRELLVEIRSAAQEAVAKDSERVRAEHLSAMAGMPIGTRPSGERKETPREPEAQSDPGAKAATSRPTRAQLLTALIEAKGNVSAAARELGLHRTQLKRHLDYHGIDPDRLRDLGK